MRVGFVALAALIFGVSVARADYLFMQYTMKVKQDPPAGSNEQPKEIRLILQSAVELKGAPTTLPTASGSVKYLAKHKYGQTSLYNDEDLITKQMILPTVKARFNSKKAALDKARTPNGVYLLAEFALNHNLIDEFAAIMDEEAKSGKKTGEDKLDKAVECYTQVKEALAKKIEREDSSNYWRSKLGFRMSQSEQGHYSLLYNAPLSDPPEVKRRLELLEQNMRAVYFWFALKGVVLKMPEQKLVAVVFDQPQDFQLQQANDDETPVADGFFSARDNLAVFSSQRLDPPSSLFNKQMQSLWQQGWNRDDLLTGKGVSKMAGKTDAEKARVATLALLDKALEEEAERAAVSHIGTRQILIGAGLQRANVVMPDWIEFGMASVMETPKGPYPLAPVEVRAPYWGGYGAPSWAYTRLFKHFDGEYAKGEEGGLPLITDFSFSQAAKIMHSVVTNRDFNRAHAMGIQRGQLALIEARTHAWALSYFLLKMRPKGVMALYSELAKLPRDMEPEPDDLLACFCRAFDVADTTGTKMDQVKFDALAKEWQGFMKTVNPPGTDVRLGLEAPQPGQPPPGGGSGGGAPKGG